MHKLEQVLSRTENALTFVAAIPILGSPAGVLKISLGTVQTIAAVAFVVLGIIPRAFDHKEMFDCAVVHVRNGLGNIVSGAVETIPLVGTVLFLMRIGKAQENVGRFSQLYAVDDAKLASGDEAEKKKEADNRSMKERFVHTHYSVRSQLIKFQTYPTLYGKQFDDSTQMLPEVKPPLDSMPVAETVVTGTTEKEEVAIEADKKENGEA
jgi:hypothetical protein